MTATANRHTFYANDRGPDVMHVETDGVMVDIEVGLHDADGRKVTRVDVTIEDAARGGDAGGRTWVRDGARYVRLFPEESSLPGVTPPHPPLTMDTVHLLSRLGNAVTHGRRVRFFLNDDDAVVKGELRHIVRPDSIALLPGDADPRDGRVRITVDLGVEYLLPVTDVLGMIARAEFGFEDS